MSNILSATVEIEGTRPLLFNPFGPDSIPLVKSERTGVAGNDPQEWKRRSCWNEQRQLYLKPSAVFASIRDGGRFTKKGRGSIQPNISATLQIEEPVVLIDRFLPDEDVPNDPVAPVYIDTRGVQMNASGSWNVRYRLAASRGWRTTFHVSFDKTILSRRELEAACRDAGKYVGIGDGRNIGCGRFDVIRFEVSDATGQAAA